MDAPESQIGSGQARPSGMQWFLVLVLAGGAAYVFTGFGRGTTSGWPTDFESARQASAESGKPLLIQFSGPG